MQIPWYTCGLLISYHHRRNRTKNIPRRDTRQPPGGPAMDDDKTPSLSLCSAVGYIHVGRPWEKTRLLFSCDCYTGESIKALSPQALCFSFFFLIFNVAVRKKVYIHLLVLFFYFLQRLCVPRRLATRVIHRFGRRAAAGLLFTRIIDFLASPHFVRVVLQKNELELRKKKIFQRMSRCWTCLV